MKRFYSHYAFIYPATYLRNAIIELDADKYIVSCFPFEGEIEKTEFYSGLLLFMPQGIIIEDVIKNIAKQDKSMFKVISSNFTTSYFAYIAYDEEGFLINS